MHKLRKNGVNGRMFNVIKDMYLKSEACVKNDGKRTDFFKDNVGVKQGELLSPLLFCRRIEYAPHTSILIYGQEYFWGGGLQKMKHEDFVEQTGKSPVEYLEVLPHGVASDVLRSVSSTA